MRAKVEKGGLFTPMKLTQPKYQLSGIHGCILHQIESKKKHDLEKFEWQKPHRSNLTGTEKAYYPNKNKDDVVNKKYKSWKSE